MTDGFGIDHLPYGIAASSDGPGGVVTRLADRALHLDRAVAAGVLDVDPALVAGPTLNALMGSADPGSVRGAVQELLSEPDRVPAGAWTSVSDLDLALPVAVADYVDFYSSIEHATNVGRLFRPDSDPLLPNWRHLPVGYHGRSGTVVVSGTEIPRPAGQRRGEDGPTFGPSQRLDIELEVGFVVGAPSTRGQPVPIDDAPGHVFGVALVDDWSARDIQAWEYQPLGPFLGKSFATSMAAWITPLEALEPYRTPGPTQEPQPLQYLRPSEPWGLDIDLEVGLRTAQMAADGADFEVISSTGFSGMYWTLAQQLAHLTVNGASVRTGDLFASGTVSGPDRGTEGSLLELTRNGAEPLTLSDGTRREFLADGDEVVLRGRCGDDLTLGEVVGRIVGA